MYLPDFIHNPFLHVYQDCSGLSNHAQLASAMPCDMSLEAQHTAYLQVVDWRAASPNRQISAHKGNGDDIWTRHSISCCFCAAHMQPYLEGLLVVSTFLKKLHSPLRLKETHLLESCTKPQTMLILAQGADSGHRLPAQRFIKDSCWVVSCVLSEGKFPKSMPYLVTTLPNLYGDELARHPGMRQLALNSGVSK